MTRPAGAPDPSTVRYDGDWHHLDVHANGIRFHVAEVGGPGRPLVVLLHGFADIWYSWRHQLASLDAAGYHAVAVDLRGYGDTDKPPRGYDGWTLAGDVAGLIRAMGHSSATLVGHADGGLVCWAAAALQARYVEAIALISSPHPLALRRRAIVDPAQREALLGQFLRHQLPRRAEAALTADDGAAVETMMRDRSGRAWPHTADFTDATTKLRSAIQIPGAAHSALEYQRWAFRSQFRAEGLRFVRTMDQPLSIPALHLHGARDPYVLASTISSDSTWAPSMQFHTLDEIGHYAHQEAPGGVNEILLAWLAQQQR